LGLFQAGDHEGLMAATTVGLGMSFPACSMTSRTSAQVTDVLAWHTAAGSFSSSISWAVLSRTVDTRSTRSAWMVSTGPVRTSVAGSKDGSVTKF